MFRQPTRQRLAALAALAGMTASLLSFALLPVNEAVADELPTVSLDTTFDAGAYIVDMGQSSDPSVDLLPYGFVYELMANQQIPVSWAIRSDKVKDGIADEIDFSVDGVDYRGGAFIVSAEYAADAMATITAYRGMGVRIDGPVSAFDAPLFSQISSWPNAVLDLQNGSIAAAYYENANISTDAYRVDLPSNLNECDDIYVMPHADPEWGTHSNLVTFNDNGGYIWAACHAVSVLENVDDPASADPAPDMNFLSVDGLIDFGDHGDGDGVYSYNALEGGDPIMQFIGRIDGATENGSEQIYLPAAAGWRPTSEVLVYDDDHPEVPSVSPGEAAKLIYGRGFGSPTNGLVMYEGGHTLNKGDGPAVVAAQRAFFNLHLLSAIERGMVIDVTTPDTIGAAETVPVSAVINGGSHNYDWTWTSSCGGSFAVVTGSQDNTATGDPVPVATTFTAPAGSTDCVVRLAVTDTCGRESFGAATPKIVEFVDLSLDKTDRTDPAEAGGPLVYDLVIDNNSAFDATNVVVTDILPPEGTYVSAVLSQGSCSYIGGQAVCDLGTLPAFTSATIAVTVVIDPGTSGVISNNASVTADQPDPNPGDETASEDTTVFVNGLTLEKSATPTAIDADAIPSTVTYTFLVGNDGPDALTNVAISDDQCSPVTFVGGDAANPGVFDPGEEWEYTCSASVSVDTTNVATVTAEDPLGNTLERTDDVFVNVVAPSISIAKGPETQDAPENGEAVFDITVTNDGDVDLVDAFVTDPLAPSCERFVRSLPVGDSLSFRCSLTVGLAGSAGTNTIDVVAGVPGGGTVTASDTADWTVVAADLAIAKTNDASGPFVPGDTVTYTITVENTGATTQNDLVVTDVLPDGFDWVSTNVNRPVAILAEDFSHDVKTQYPLAWEEWTDDVPADRTAGDIKFTGCTAVAGDTQDCSILLDKADEGLFQTVDLTGVTDLDVTFDWAVQKTEDGTGSFTLAMWNGSSWQTAGGPYVLTAVGGFTTVTVNNIDPSALGAAIAGGRIGFITDATNTGNDEVLLDDVTISWSGGSITDQFIDPRKDYWNGWQEGEGTDTFNGDIRVVDDDTDADCNTNADCVLRLKKKNKDVWYPIDLTGFTSATVDFDWRTFDNDSGSGFFELVVWDGAAYQVVQTFNLDAVPTASFSPESVTFDPSAVGGAVAAGRIGFRNGTVSDNDRPYLDNVVISVLGDTAGNPSPNLVTAGDDVDLGPGAIMTITVVATIDPTLDVFYARDQVNTASATSDETTTPVSAASAVEVVVPGVGITKTAAPALVSPGDPVTYTFEVINTGNDPVTPALTDPDCSPISLDSGDTANPGVLDLLETWVYSCTTTSPVAVNTATVNATDSLANPVPQAQDSATVEIIDSDIAVVKTADETPIRAGESVTYHFDVTTAASVEPLIGVYVEDGILVADDGCMPVLPLLVAGFNVGDVNTDGALDPGETWEFECTTSLLTTTTNVATAHGADRAGAEVTATDTATVDVIDARIALDKVKLSPADPVIAGSNVTYGFNVTNPGNDPLGSVSVDDSLCSPVAFVGGDVANIGFLDPGETWNYTCSRVLAIDTLKVAGVTGTDSLSGTVTDDDEVFVDVYGAELRLGKVADTGLVRVGDDATYTYKVFNSGDTNFPDFAGTGTISDDICSPLVRVLPDVDGDGDDDLEPGESWGYTCTSTILLDTLNTFSASGTDEFATVVTAEDATAFVAALDPALDVVKAADLTTVLAGTSVTYTYEVTNSGTIANVFNNINVTGVSDDTCAPVSFVGGDDDGDGQLGFDETTGDPETWIYSCTTTVNSDTTNTVTVAGTDTLGNSIADATDTEFVDVVLPDFEVVKTAGGAADGATLNLTAPGGPVTYTYAVENTGTTNLTDVALVDSPACAPITLTAGDVANPGVLDIGETWTYECTQSISVDTTNTVTVTADDPWANTLSRQDTAVVDVVAPVVNVVTTAGGAADGETLFLDAPGGPVTYTYEVTNPGDTVLGSVSLSDNVCSPVSAPTKTGGDLDDLLEAGETWTYTCDHTVGADTVNIATVTANPVNTAGDDLPGIADASDTDPADVDVVAPGITVVKTVGAVADGETLFLETPGGPVTYTYEVTNTGDTVLGSVDLSDDVCSPVSVPTKTGGDLDDLLEAGETWTYTCDQTIAVDTVNTATIAANPVNAAGDDLPGIADATDTDTANVDVVAPAVNVVTTAGGAADGETLFLDAPGGPVTYTYEVTNTGDTILGSVSLSDDVCSPVSAPVKSGGDLDDLLETGETWTYTCDQTIGADTVNIATVTANPVDGAGADLPGIADATDTDTANVDVVAPGITVVKTAGGGADGDTLFLPASGGSVTYTYEVTNTGDTILGSVSLSDDLCSPVSTPSKTGGDLDDLLEAGETWTYTCDQTITEDTVNTATVTANPVDTAGDNLPGIADATDTDTADVDVLAPAVNVVTTAGGAADGETLFLDAPGGPVTYTYEVTNTGDTVLGSVSLTDDVCSPVSAPSKTGGDLDDLLEAGETWTYTCDQAISSDTVNIGSVTANPVGAAGGDLLAFGDATDTDPADVDVVAPGITVVKTAGAVADDETLFLETPGGPVTYTYEVTNTGDTILGSVSLSDDVCSPVSAPSKTGGDLDDLLETGETWTYTCDQTITEDTVNTATVTANPVNAAGDDLAGIADATDTDTADVDVVAPAVNVVTTAGGAADGETLFLDAPGGPVTYTYEVTNTGDTILGSVDLSDDVCSPVSAPSKTGGDLDDLLEAGETWTYTCDQTIGADTVNIATVTANPVDATGDDLPGIADATDTDTANVDVVAPGITVVKTAGAAADGDTLFLPASGGSVTYTYEVTNTGDTILGSVSLSDDLCSPVSTPSKTGGDLDDLLETGETWTYTCDQTITEDTVNTATVTANPVNAAGDNLAGIADATDTDTAVVDVVAPAVNVVTTAGGAADGETLFLDAPGGPVTYTYEVTNPGDTVLGSVSLTDDVCSPVSAPVKTGGDLDDLLEAGETWTYTCDQAISSDTVNTATVTANPVNATGDDLPSIADASDTDPADVDVVAPGITVVKTAGGVADGETLFLETPGGPVTYTYEVTNTGDTVLGSVDLSDDVCSPVSAPTKTGGDLDDLLEAGETWTYTCDQTIAEDTVNTATVTANPVNTTGDNLPDIADATDTDTANVDVVAPGITVVKTAGAAANGDTLFLETPGGPVTYTYKVTNTGHTVLGSLSLTDDVCSPVSTPTKTGGDLDDLLEAGETWTYTCDQTIAEDTVNIATVTANPVDDAGDDLPDIADAADTDTANVDVVATGITVVKTAGAAADGETLFLAAPGGMVTYTYEVTNTGDVWLSDVEVVDDNGTPDPGDDASCAAAPVAPGGGTETCTLGLWVSTDTVNTAIVSGTPADGAGGPALPGFVDVTDEDSAIVDLVDPGITVVKTAGPAADGESLELAPPGGPVTYDYVVTNTGDTVLGSVSLSDDRCDPVSIPVKMGGDLDDLLEAGETWSYTCSHLLTLDTVNTATATANPVDVAGEDLPGLADVTDTDTAEVNVIEIDLAIDIELVGELVVGGPATYLLNVSNAGPDTATEVEVRAPMPDGLAYSAAAGSGWDCSASTTLELVCTTPSLAPGAAPQIELTVAVSTVASGEIVVEATVGSFEVEPEPVRFDNTDSVPGTISSVSTPPLAFTGSRANDLILVGAAAMILGWLMLVPSRRRLRLLES